MEEKNNAEAVSTQSDDAANVGQTEQELLDAVMKNSPIMDEVEGSLPEEEIPEVDPTETETEEEDPVESEEVVKEEVEEEEVEEEEVPAEDAAEEAATQESETYELDELDDFTVNLKIDGEVTPVKLSDMAKGFSTEQSLSKKGRELGEARKALDEERAAKLKELEDISSATAAVLYQGEQGFAKEYNDLEKKIEEARKDNDTFTMGELKDQREQAQKKYWEARRQREGMLAAVNKQKEEQQAKVFKEQLEHFEKVIPELIPNFNEDMAGKIRDFAIKDLELDPNVLNSITDPKIVKALNDFRVLKEGTKKGVAKRKAVPTKKAVPVKKAASPQKKAEDKDKMIKARAFKEDASVDDQMAFLRQYASKSLNT